MTDRDDSSDHYRRRDPLEAEVPEWHEDTDVPPGGAVAAPDALGAPE